MRLSSAAHARQDRCLNHRGEPQSPSDRFDGRDPVRHRRRRGHTKGIAVTTVPPLVTESTADICFGLMIAVARRIVEGDQLVRRGGFPGGQSNHLIGSGVFSKTLGLVGGGGRIGSAVARRARGFQMNVLYWSPRRKPPEFEQELGLTFVPLGELLRRSDFVSIHSPLREETRGQIGASELSLMKRTAFSDQYVARPHRRRARARRRA